MNLQPLSADAALEYEDRGGEVVDRDFLQAQIDLWETAIGKSVPSSEEVAETSRAFQLDDVMTAPRVESGEKAPARTYYYDGFVPRSEEEIDAELAELVREVVQVSINTDGRRVYPGPRKKARRVYVFDEPVHEAQRVDGELFVPGSDQTRDPWTPGTPTTVLVEVLPARDDEETEAKRVNAICRVTGSRATWFPDEEDE